MSDLLDFPERQSSPVASAHVLIVGVSTRAAAESAARAGFEVTAIDAFADRDQHPSVQALSCERDFNRSFDAMAVADVASRHASDAVAYLSPVENDLRAISLLSRGRSLWGNPAEVLVEVRDPREVRHALAASGAGVPRLVMEDSDLPTARTGSWLLKPMHSGGGSGVIAWNPAERVPSGMYLQEAVAGTVGSVVFVAAGGRAVPIGLSRQLVGDGCFGASGYRYCGTIIGAAGDTQFDDDERLLSIAVEAAETASARFGLVGVNGLDFVARDGIPHVIEINPRWSSSMEVVERAYGISVFGMHAAACTQRTLPSFDLIRARRASGASGRAIVYARQDVVVGDTDGWLADPTVRDVPHAGERVSTGRPICSVLASADDSRSCYDALVARASAVFADVARWRWA